MPSLSKLIYGLVVGLAAADTEININFAGIFNGMGSGSGNCPTPTPAAPSTNPATAQLSSLVNQLGSGVVKLESHDALDRMTVMNDTKVCATVPGYYFVIAAAQVGCAGTCARGDIDLWMSVNGEDVGNSNTRTTLGAGTMVLVSQGITWLKMNDCVSVEFSTTNGGGLIFSHPTGQPAIPSIIFSATQLGSTFAQLSSPTNQVQAGAHAVSLPSFDVVEGIAVPSLLQQQAVCVPKTGMYLVFAAGQVGCTTDPCNAVVDLWVTQDGQMVGNSNTRAKLGNTWNTTVLVSQGVLPLSAGSCIGVSYSSSQAGAGLIALTPSGEPAIPSIIFTLYEVDGNVFAQLSSPTNQTGGNPGTVMLQFTDGASNVTVQNSNSVCVNVAGSYLVMAAAQVGCTQATCNGAEVALWLTKNGQDIDNSNTLNSVNSDTMVLMTQVVLTLAANDCVGAKYATANANAGLLDFAPQNEPAIPSIIFTLISNKIPM